MIYLETINEEAKPNHVRNLITNEVMTFHNGYDLETNLISAIIIQEYEMAHLLLDDEFRQKVTCEAKRTWEFNRIGKGSIAVISEAFDLISFMPKS